MTTAGRTAHAPIQSALRKGRADRISGKTTLIAHVGYPAETFKAPLIYNPDFDKAGIDAVVVPMVMKPANYPMVLKSLFQLTNMQAAKDRGCRYQVGTDMLFEQIPAYLEFFGFPTTTPEELRAVVKVAF
jgi:shikimate 5-dehydrogenase